MHVTELQPGNVRSEIILSFLSRKIKIEKGVLSSLVVPFHKLCRAG